MSSPAHRDDVKRFIVGTMIVALGATIGYVGITVQGGGELPFKSYTEVHARFANVGTLKPQEKVTQNGVRIGQVSAIDYVDGEAEVTMRLDGEHSFYNDATARVGNESALGKKYIDISPGSKETGQLPSDLITSEHTGDAASLDDVLASFDGKARTGLAQGLQALGGGLQGHAADLHDATTVAPDLLDKGTTVVGTLADPETNLDDLLVTADQLANQFKGQADQLGTLLDQATTTFQAVNVERTAPLKETLRKLPGVLDTATTGLKAVNPALGRTASAVTRLRPGVDRLVTATPDLRGFLTESPPVARTVVQFTKDAEPALKALVPTIRDISPLIGKVSEGLTLADPLLMTLKPYWPDAGHLVSLHDLLSGHFSPTKHYFSAQLAFPGLYNVSLPDPTVDVDPYPGPGKSFGSSYK